MTPFDRLMAIRMGGGVERCHTVRHQGSYSVAAHSWGVAVIMFLLWPEDFGRLAPYCIFHDVPEAWTGDVPATAKKYDHAVKLAFDALEDRTFIRLSLPNDAALGPEDKAKLKACDHLDLYCWAREQVIGGNHHADFVAKELESFFEREPLLGPAANLLWFIKHDDVRYDLRPGYRDLFKGS